uniref:D-alanine--D-alanine ligase C-terminal domain-containing protein n=1 Tax=Panagrolaimus sp. ES5 TaxID=591445 RepID=A0AC34FGP4_9BILA
MEKMLELPELEDILEQIIQILPKEKIDLITTEERLIKSVCKIREKLEIPGPRTKDIENILDKELMLKTASKSDGLKTLKFTVLNLAKINSIKMESRRIVTEIQKFPIFYSPIVVGGNIGCGKIKNEDELKKFILQESKSVKKGCYLLEECINDLIEFWVWCVISADGECLPYSCSFGEKGVTTAEHNSGDPIIFQAHLIDDKCENAFPKLTEFVQNVATILRPPGPHIFGIKGFQRQTETSDYFFKDVFYGINGERETLDTFNSTKISHETVALLCHLSQNYSPKFECHEIPHRRLIWYPCVKGILQSQEELSKKNSITSELEYRWFINAGQKMETPTNLDNFMLCLTVENSDLAALEKDTEFIRTNFHPHVIRDGST